MNNENQFDFSKVRKTGSLIKNEDDYHLRYNIGHTISKNLSVSFPWLAPDIAETILRHEVKKAIEEWLKNDSNNR